MLDGKVKPKGKPGAAAAKAAAPKSDKKAAHAKPPAAAAKPGGGYAAQRGALKPPVQQVNPDKAPKKAVGAEDLKLPGSTTELLESTSLQVAQVAAYQGAKGMPAPVARMLVEGVQREGVSDARTLDAILSEYIDGGEVEVYRVAGGGKSLQWLRFWCGDTEVGYMFDGSRMVAIVGDQQINPL